MANEHDVCTCACRHGCSMQLAEDIARDNFITYIYIYLSDLTDIYGRLLLTSRIHLASVLLRDPAFLAIRSLN